MTTPSTPPKLDSQGRVRMADDPAGLLDGSTPIEDRFLVVLSLQAERQREIQPVIRRALDAVSLRDERRAAAWNAVVTVASSKLAIPGFVCVAFALSVVTLELAGVDLAQVPALIQAARSCPP